MVGKGYRPVRKTGKPGRPRIRLDNLPVPRKPGRPSKYNPEFANTIYYARALGKTNLEIIEQLGVNAETFYKWLKEKPEFKRKYDEGRYALDELASKALFYKLQPQKLKRVEHKEYLDRNGEKQALNSTLEQEVVPDVLALNNYLNRRIKSFKIDTLDDPNNEKVDQLLACLAALVPEKMQAVLDRKAAAKAQEVVAGQTIDVSPDEPNKWD